MKAEKKILITVPLYLADMLKQEAKSTGKPQNTVINEIILQRYASADTEEYLIDQIAKTVARLAGKIKAGTKTELARETAPTRIVGNSRAIELCVRYNKMVQNLNFKFYLSDTPLELEKSISAPDGEHFKVIDPYNDNFGTLITESFERNKYQYAYLVQCDPKSLVAGITLSAGRAYKRIKPYHFYTVMK